MNPKIHLLSKPARKSYIRNQTAERIYLEEFTVKTKEKPENLTLKVLMLVVGLLLLIVGILLILNICATQKHIQNNEA